VSPLKSPKLSYSFRFSPVGNRRTFQTTLDLFVNIYFWLEKSKNLLGSVIKSPQNDYYTKTRNLCTSIVNLKDTNIYLRGFKRTSENYRQLGTPFGIEKSKQIFKAYKKPDVTKNLLRCYKTLFEAEQRTHEIFTGVFYPKENICRA